ncbi:hypothetical protein M422DRAFT_240848 [Sphaerobolus stellatus SS14]|nr:hypothetical protein M422DRAFT_240848 [Sphaerobolus stellatus SS14]
MSATASSSKSTTTANAILYKKSKDVPCLPFVEKSDSRRTLVGFKAVVRIWGLLITQLSFLVYFRDTLK